MIIFAIITRSTNVLAEYGATPQNFTELMIPIVGKNLSSGTRLVPVGNHLCAVMNKGINKETITFACIIESNEERDNSFNFLDSLASYFEKEINNPKMTTEMNSFLSKSIKNQLVLFFNSKEKANNKINSKEKLESMNDRLSRTTEITQGSISTPFLFLDKLVENRVKLDELDGRSDDLRNTVSRSNAVSGVRTGQYEAEEEVPVGKVQSDYRDFGSGFGIRLFEADISLHIQ